MILFGIVSQSILKCEALGHWFWPPFSVAFYHQAIHILCWHIFSLRSLNQWRGKVLTYQTFFLSSLVSTGLDMLACLSDPQSSWSRTNNWHLIRVVLCVVDNLLILKLECHLQSPMYPCVSVYLCVSRSDINHCACLCCMTVQDWELGHAHHPHTAGTAVG